MCKSVLTLAIAITSSLLLPAPAMAQSAIAGIVKDTAGAAVPGATVEAGSPALIEKSRTTTTDEAGQYRLVDLRPGTYRVTVSLAGFRTVVTDGLVLQSDSTAPLNVELALGAIAETVTVRAPKPVVDVQTAQRREVVTAQMLDALPTGRNYQLMAATVPSVTANAFDVGGSSTMWTGGALLAHGSLAIDSRTMIDGMVADCMFGAGQSPCLYDNEAQTEEIAVQVTAGAAENQLSGVLVNRIPRTGGNTFHGEGMFFYANDALQGTNLDDELRARTPTVGTRLYRAYDVNYSLGGPIVPDRVWFFVSGRHNAYNNYVTVPDGTQAADDNAAKSFPGRVTAQLTPKNRVTGMFDWANKVRGHRKLSSVVAPEASIQQSQPAEHIAQVKWVSAVSSHLLVETGFTQQFNGDRFRYEPEVVPGTCHVSFSLCPQGTTYGSIAHEDLTTEEQSVAAVPALGLGQSPGANPALSNYLAGSLSYVTGGHSLKVGIQDRWGYSKDIRPDINGDIIQQYREGKASSVQALNTPISNEVNVNADLGVYIQDTWTSRRLTLVPGLRWDHFNSSVPEQVLPAGRFVSARRFDAIHNLPNWNNVSPRIGGSYDLTGRAKTAVKGSFGVYVESQGPVYARTYNPAVFAMDQRSWTDLNHDDIAQEDEIGPARNGSFRTRTPDPALRRPHQRVWDVGIQHELVQGLAVSVSYNQRGFHDIIWTQNLAAPFSEYTLLSIPDPLRNGQMLPVYNLNQAVRGLVNELDTNSSSNTRVYRGVDVSFNWRLPGSALISGGTSTGRTLTRTCDVEDPNSLQFCDYSQYHIPFQTLFKVSGMYPLPHDVHVSALFQHVPGTERIAIYNISKTELPTLVPTSVNIRLNEPGTLFNDTVNQLDFTVSKSFRQRLYEVRPELSLFNAFNANPVLTRTNKYGSDLGNPLTILPPRMARLGLTVRF